jgi:parallel beta-helix repeat protein
MARLRTLLVAGAVTALTVAVIPVPSAALAVPSQLACGDVITTDIKLASDLTNCPNNGIVVEADDIALDLNGHTVGGDGTPFASCPDGAFCDVGIDNSAGHSGVTIKGGTVRGFDVGALALGAGVNRIQKLTLVDNASFGVIVGNSSDTKIDHNSAHGGISGILMFDSHDNRLEQNTVSGAHGYAIPVFGSHHNRLEQNSMDGNDHGILLDTCDDNDVKANRVSHSGGSSIDIGHSKNNRVVANVLTDNGDGVILADAQHNLISDNSVTGTGLFGFPDTGGFGVILDGADDNLVQRNKVTGGRGPAIFVSSLESPDTSDRNAISANVVNSKFTDGILIDGNATLTLLDHNTANGNGNDGIHANATGTTITGNTANDNHELGIEAVLGVVDGSGNKASGNGNPAQCLNVLCR